MGKGSDESWGNSHLLYMASYTALYMAYNDYSAGNTLSTTQVLEAQALQQQLLQPTLTSGPRRSADMSPAILVTGGSCQQQ